MYRKIAWIIFLLVSVPSIAIAGWDEGVAAFTKKDYRKAVSEFSQVLQNDPHNWEAHYYLGRSYAGLGDYRAAENALRHAELSAERAKKKIWKQLGFVYEKQKKYAESANAYELAGDQKSANRVMSESGSTTTPSRVKTEETSERR